MSAKVEPFQKYHREYEEWFIRNKNVYESELAAIGKLVPKSGEGLEIGVGSGRFAEPLGIKHGVEPSKEMARYALERGVKVIEGVAEKLPYPAKEFDYVVMITTICFVDDLDLSLREAYRVLKDNGSLIIGFIDKNSPLGKQYQKYKEQNPFYRVASFRSTEEITEAMRGSGFKGFQYVQTVFRNLEEVREKEPIKDGYGEGSFVGIKGIKIEGL
jgi:ubiquinone/menaquinone biosynthesis C-methylase UbiE